MKEKSKTLLLVEDEAIIAMDEARQLGIEGYTVVQAYSGSEAIEIVGRKGEDIDLILMDIDLGRGMDGTDAAREILKDHDIPVVFLSSHTERDIVEKTEAITSYGYVVKNTGITVLDASIKMAFKLFEAHRGIRAKGMEIEAVNEELHSTIEEMEASNEELVRSQRELLEQEMALKKSELRYRRLFEQNTDAIFIADLETRMLIDCNNKAEILMGYSRYELLAMRADLLHPEGERARTMEYFSEFITGRLHTSIESAVLTKEGDVVPVSINASRVDTGGTTRLLGVFRDISAQKHAEEELEASNILVNSIIEQSPYAMWLSDSNGTMMRINRACCEMLNISPDEVVGKYNIFQDNIVEEQGFSELVRSVFDRGETARFEIRYDSSQLKQISVGNTAFVILQVTIFPIRNTSGVITNAVIQHNDITGRRIAEVALHESEKLLRRAQSIARLGHFKFNPLTNEVEGSDELFRVYGLSREEFQFSNFVESVHPDDRDFVVATIGNAIEKRQSYDIEHRLILRDGTLKFIKAIGEPVLDEDGAVAFMVGTVHDITERKRDEDALKGRDSLIASISNNLPSTMIYQVIRGRDGGRRFTYVSETVRLFYGCSPDEAMADPGLIYGRVMEEDRDRVMREEEAANAALSTFKTQARLITPDGGTRWSQLISSPEKLGDGSTRWDGIEIDITVQKRMEEALRESNDIFNDIVSSQPAGIYRIRVKSNNDWTSGDNEIYSYEFISDRYCEMTGVSREELMADPAITLGQIHPEDYDEFIKLNEMSNRDITPFIWEGRMVIRGETKWMHYESRPRRLGNGEVIWTGVLLDITRGKHAEEELHIRDEQLRIIFETSQAGIILVSPAGIITFANRRMAEMFGCSLDELVNSAYPDHVHPDQKSTGDERMRSLIRGEVDHVYTERHYVRADGTDFWGYLTGRRHEDADGNLVSLVGIISDITEWRRARDQELAYINFLEKLEEVDRIIRRADDLDAMLVDILDRAWSMFESDRAWLLNPCDPGAMSFRVKMMRTRDEYALGLAPDTDVTVTPDVADAFRAALDSSEPLVFDQSTGRRIPLADDFSIRSQMIIVLRPKMGDPWIFGLHQCSHARIWTLDDQRLFREIARRITDGLNSMLLFRELRESEDKYRTLVENSLVGVGVSRGMEIIYANKALLEMYVCDDLDDFRGKPLNEYLTQESRDSLFERIRKIEKGEAVPEMFRQDIIARDGRIKTLEVAINTVTINGEPCRLSAFVDITERKKAEEDLARTVRDKDVLMKELQHRVKNNLGVISGLLSLEMQNIKEAQSREVFRDAMDRIQSMSTIYEQLYQSSSLDRVDLKQYVGDIVRRLLETYVLGSARIRLSLKLEDADLNVRRTVPLGLILNELITNSLKYAYPSGRGGELRVRLLNESGTITLEISDDGIGLPDDVRTGKSAGMGIRLVEMLADQIEATLALESDKGTTVRIAFPVDDRT